MSPRPPRISVTYDELYELHWDKKMSYRKMATKLGCSPTYVHKLMKRLGVPVRWPLTEAIREERDECRNHARPGAQ